MRIHTSQTITEVKNLRRQGYSITQLVKTFNLPKTTIWHHIQGVKVPEKYSKILKDRQGRSRRRSEADWNKARTAATNIFNRKLTDPEKLLIATMLYWGEGSKRDFNLANSDPELVSTFLRCVETLGISRKQFALHVRTYEDLDTIKSVEFWKHKTGIDKVVKVEVLKGKKKGKLPFGMCRVRLLKGGYYLKFLNAIKEIVQKV